MKNVAALFVRKNSIYKTIDGVDSWDAQRDAAKYPGSLPVVAHPPCGAWGRYRQAVDRNNIRKADAHRALGLRAVEFVRRYGGVLEQPANSGLWSAAGLPRAGVDRWGGYTVEVFQRCFGHRADKLTWLYVVNGQRFIEPWAYDFTAPFKEVEFLSRKGREATPFLFARWLVTLATCTDSTRGVLKLRLPCLDQQAPLQFHVVKDQLSLAV